MLVVGIAGTIVLFGAQRRGLLERIYVGCRFRNDSERLEKLFELYTKMTAGSAEASRRKHA